MHSTVRLRGLATTALGLVFACTAAGAALAQTPAAPPAASGEESVTEVVVTGTSIRGIAAVGSESITLKREELEATGRNTPVDVLRELPQIQNLGYDDAQHVAQNGAGNIQRGSTVNLRGLGSNATLVLVDGHRIAPTGNVFSFTDGNQLPVLAIERVDVIADGASAIYGSDAVAGVINYISRKNFDGIEVQARGTTTNGYDQWGAGIVGGRSWEYFGGGSAVVAYDHDERGEMIRGVSPFLRQDLTRFGGNDGRVGTNNATSAAPGNIIVPAAVNNPTLPTAGRFTFFGLPPGSSGVGVTAAQLLLNQPNLADSSDYASYLPDTVRDQVSVNINQTLTPWLSTYYRGFYNYRRSDQYSYPTSGARTIPATSPFYISGVPGLAAGAAETVVFSFYKDIGRATSYITDAEQGHNLGAKANLPHEWVGELSYSSSIDRNCANCVDAFNANIDTAVLQAELTAGRLNPFGSTPTDPAELRKFMVPGWDRSRSTLNVTTLRFDGPLIELPGGPLKGAVGFEHQYIDQARTSIGIKATSDTIGAYSERKVDSAYAELFVPIVGESNAVPYMQALSLDLAIRTEDYSDFGKTTNPKIGLRWDVNNELRINGAWGESFRAPNLIETNPEFFSRVALVTQANGAGDPTIPVLNTATGTSNFVSVQGSNPGLVPETATNYSYGFDYSPAWLDGLRTAVTYYNIEYANQIIGLQTFLPTFLSNATNRALYAPYIVVAPQPATCVNGQSATYNPLYLVPLGRASLVPPDQSNFCSAAAILYGQNANSATNKQDGIDVKLSYRHPTSVGDITVGTDFTQVFHNRQSLVKGGTETNSLDIVNFPISLRGRGYVNWMKGVWGGSLAANYVGSYQNNLPITVAGVLQPKKLIPAWVTVDATLSYRFEGMGPALEGLRLSLNIRNITDRNPPVVLSGNGNAMDVQNANPFGRIWSLTATKRF